MHDIDFRTDGFLKFNLFSSNYRCMFIHEMITSLSSYVLPSKISQMVKSFLPLLITRKIQAVQAVILRLFFIVNYPIVFSIFWQSPAGQGLCGFDKGRPLVVK